MKISQNNKQSASTRVRIKKAVAVLLKDRAVEDIKVTEITSLSGVSRNTFYTHYAKISDVLKEITSDLILDFESVFTKYKYSEFSSNPKPFIKELVSMCKKSPAFLEYVVFSNNANGILQGTIDAVTDKFYKIYRLERGEDNYLVPYLISYLISGVAQYLYKWFKDGQKINSDELINQLSSLIKNSVSVLRGVKNENT
ncbi:MAG: TetR/AcrR family transcriptional regulator [Clostridia bacterium]|nr:TetR/AcrR family transcriptional regulator [Clostridia bacterium]